MAVSLVTVSIRLSAENESFAEDVVVTTKMITIILLSLKTSCIPTYNLLTFIHLNSDKLHIHLSPQLNYVRKAH